MENFDMYWKKRFFINWNDYLLKMRGNVRSQKKIWGAYIFLMGTFGSADLPPLWYWDYFVSHTVQCMWMCHNIQRQFVNEERWKYMYLVSLFYSCTVFIMVVSNWSFSVITRGGGGECEHLQKVCGCKQFLRKKNGSADIVHLYD